MLFYKTEGPSPASETAASGLSRTACTASDGVYERVKTYGVVINDKLDYQSEDSGTL